MATAQERIINGKVSGLGNDLDNDPVAANLVKVINILNKHHLADGLDLRHLKDSIGFEQDANNKKLTLTSGVKGTVQRKRSGLSNVKATENSGVNGRRERTVVKVDDGDGSYLGVAKVNGSKSEMEKLNVKEQLTVGADRIGSTSGQLNHKERLTDSESRVRRSPGVSPCDSGRGSSQTGVEPGNTATYSHLKVTNNNPKTSATNHLSDTQHIPLSSTKDTQSASHCRDLHHVQSTTSSGNDLRTLTGQPTDNVTSTQRTMGTGCHSNRVLVDVNDNDMDTDMLGSVVRGGCHGDDVGNHGNRTQGPCTTATRSGKTGVDDFKAFYWKIEVEEWSRINKQLRQHGLPPVDVLHPKRATTLSDTVVLEPEMARTLRQTLQTLMKDCDRRQGLVQELIVTNNHLRDHPETPGDGKRNELSEQTSTTERYESRARDLKVQLDSSRSKVEDLEEDRLVRSSGYSEEERLRNTKNAIQARCRELQKKVEDQQLEINTLRAQLDHAKQQDQNFKRRHEEALLKLKKQAPKNARIDDKTLDVIDSYERQIYSLQRQLELREDNPSNDPVSQEATPNYKALIKSYERDIRDSRKKTKELENDNQLLRIDLQSRPEMKDFRASQQRVKKLERTLREHNIRFDGKGQSSHLTYSSRTEDLDFLPLAQCQQHLRHICEQLGVEDVEHVNATIRKQQRALEAQPKMEEFAQKVLTLANTPGVPVPPEYTNRHRVAHGTHEVWCDKTWHHVLPTLEHWVTQLKALKDLQTELVKLTAMLSPSGVTGLDADPPSVTKMVTAIRSLHTDDNRHQSGNHGNKDAVSRAVLQGIVDHFMTLFDVTKISGVYARMNDVYTKLGEVHNTMTTLRSLLGLPSDARGSAVVDATARLCQTHNKATTEQLREMLNVDDLNSVVRMLEEHREFFPVFQEIMSKLMEICGCHRLDQVIPTVRALKMLAG